jgi:ribosomal protein S18 acetylase RimI-like enzyme
MNDASRPTDPVRHAVLEAIAAIAPETDLAQLRDDRPLRTQIELDSMDWLNLLQRVERRIGVALPDPLPGATLTLEALLARLKDSARTPAATGAAARTDLPTIDVDIAGQRVHVRPMNAGDRQLEVDFVRGLSKEARYKRFMTTVAELPKSKLGYLTNIDQATQVALVASVERNGVADPVGVVRYAVNADGTSCEFAIALDDDFQRTGLAGVLMRLLIDIARGRGLKTMEGLVLASNTAMLKFARQLGFTAQHEPDDYSTVHVTLAL